MTDVQPTAAILLIGNEILSGRTEDKNLHYIAQELTILGINLIEARVIGDDEDEIITSINLLREKCDYVFTTGGIGPTHDDITAAAVAKAFNLTLEKHPKAWELLKAQYSNPDDFNEARQKMAYIPQHAMLIDNPISAAPGFIVENVYVMAGVPVIMRAMFDNIKASLKGGNPTQSITITTNLTEGVIAQGLGTIQSGNEAVDIGSYPHIKDGKLGVSLVVRSQNAALNTDVAQQIRELVIALGGDLLT